MLMRLPKKLLHSWGRRPELRLLLAAAFVMAVSGGRTPWQMLRALAGEDVPWDAA